jgi:hypothetical protein
LANCFKQKGGNSPFVGTPFCFDVNCKQVCEMISSVILYVLDYVPHARDLRGDVISLKSFYEHHYVAVPSCINLSVALGALV